MTVIHCFILCIFYARILGNGLERNFPFFCQFLFHEFKASVLPPSQPDSFPLSSFYKEILDCHSLLGHLIGNPACRRDLTLVSIVLDTEF